MKIAIDISQIIFGTGVSKYTKNLVRELLKNDPEDKYVLYGGSMRRFSELKAVSQTFTGNYETKILAYPPTLADYVWNKLHVFPIEKILGQVDVLHTSDWSEPPSSAFKVTTVHDLYPFKFPRMVHPKVLAVHTRKLSWVIRESSRVISPSESTKEDLINLGVKEELIRVIPEAPSLSKANEHEIIDIKKKYRIQGDYLISIGVTQLKNTKKIIEAFHLSTAGKELKLVLVGRPSNIKIEPERNIRMLGFVPDEDMSALMTGSKGLIFSSLYEGYGIPILDAFACGVPVVTSNTGSMPEVAGDSAILVDPYDVSSIKEGIEKALRGPKSFVEKGEKWVAEFSWQKTARMTLDVYKEAKNK
jgi:glycosyltransferase involved in cell wall biosynthesis